MSYKQRKKLKKKKKKVKKQRSFEFYDKLTKDYCNKRITFYVPEDIQKIILMFIKKNPLKCIYCRHIFLNSKSFNTHLYDVHGIINPVLIPKKYQCNHCGHKFRSRSGVYHHKNQYCSKRCDNKRIRKSNSNNQTKN